MNTLLYECTLNKKVDHRSPKIALHRTYSPSRLFKILFESRPLPPDEWHILQPHSPLSNYINLPSNKNPSPSTQWTSSPINNKHYIGNHLFTCIAPPTLTNISKHGKKRCMTFSASKEEKKEYDTTKAKPVSYWCGHSIPRTRLRTWEERQNYPWYKKWTTNRGSNLSLHYENCPLHQTHGVPRLLTLIL